MQVAEERARVRVSSNDELNHWLLDLKAWSFSYRLQAHLGGVQRPHLARQTRRTVARINTELRARGMIAVRGKLFVTAAQTAQNVAGGAGKREDPTRATRPREAEPMLLEMPRITMRHLYVDERLAKQPDQWTGLIRERQIDRVFLDTSKVRAGKLQATILSLLTVIRPFRSLVNPVVVGPVTKRDLTTEFEEFCAKNIVHITSVDFASYCDRLRKHESLRSKRASR